MLCHGARTRAFVKAAWLQSIVLDFLGRPGLVFRLSLFESCALRFSCGLLSIWQGQTMQKESTSCHSFCYIPFLQKTKHKPIHLFFHVLPRSSAVIWWCCDTLWLPCCQSVVGGKRSMDPCSKIHSEVWEPRNPVQPQWCRSHLETELENVPEKLHRIFFLTRSVASGDPGKVWCSQGWPRRQRPSEQVRGVFDPGLGVCHPRGWGHTRRPGLLVNLWIYLLLVTMVIVMICNHNNDNIVRSHNKQNIYIVQW